MRKRDSNIKVNKYLQRIAVIIANFLLKILFARVNIFNYDDSSISFETKPIIFISNHVTSADSWLAIKTVIKTYHKVFILIAAEEVLQRLPILKKIGVFPVSKNNPMLNLRTFSIITSLVKSNLKYSLWVFPQGHHVPNDDLLNSKFSEGIIQLLKLIGNCIIIPVGYYYYSFRKPKHSVSVCLGKYIDYNNEHPLTTNDLFNAVHESFEIAKKDAVSSSYSKILYPGQKVKTQSENDLSVKM